MRGTDCVVSRRYVVVALMDYIIIFCGMDYKLA